MSRILRVVAIALALGAMAGGGFMAARHEPWSRKPNSIALGTPAPAQASVAYYQHPDGLPHYSLTPTKAADGRDFRAVPASQDISFDEEADSDATASRKVKFYRNPMGLSDTSPVPKKDQMGMAYIPVYEGEDRDDGSMKLSVGKLQRTGVKSEPAAMRVISPTIRAPGTVQFDERRIAVISMRSETWIQKVADVTTGSTVRKGQPLMQVYSASIAAAAADYVSVMDGIASTLKGASRGSKQRLQNLDVPDDAIAAIERSREAPMSIDWTAPRDGIVIERNVVDGMRAQPGDVLFRLADASLVWVLVDIAERDLGALVIGQPVTVRARSYPGRTFTGNVSVIYPQITRDTRTARIRIELPNPDIALLPDMYVDAEINTGNQQAILTVPDSAVIDTGSQQSVFVDKGAGKLEPHDVKLGMRGDGYVEIREGVHEGEAVVVSGNFLIDAESNLKSAFKGYDAGTAQ